MRGGVVNTAPLALLWLAGGLAAQPTPRTSSENPTNLFLDGWMAELLDGDQARARKFYTQAAKAKDLPQFQSELSILRLWESNWKRADRRRFRATLDQRGFYAPPNYTIPYRSLYQLRVRFDKALDAGDTEALVDLRARLARLITQSTPFRNVRHLVPSGLGTVRNEQPGDAKLDALMARRKDAERDGDTARANQLRWDIRRHRFTKATSASRRLVAKRWTKMTRLHLAGQHQRATGMERGLGGNARRFVRRRQRPIDAAAQERAIQTWAVDRRRSVLSRVQKNLVGLLGKRELLVPERAVLVELQERLDTAGAAGQPERGLILATRIPYRNLLFLRR